MSSGLKNEQKIRSARPWPWLALFVFFLGAPCFAQAQTVLHRPWNEDIIYFALTDRFYDGDPANNVPAESDPTLYDQTQTNNDRYQGGDFRGLELALQKGYFKDLGITALWITPPVRNVWYSAYDFPKDKTGYHGYWAQDFLDIDPHLVSRRSLDGKRDYPETRDGRMQHYKDLVALAHSQGIKIIQDIVLNHTGPVFYYDANGNGEFDLKNKAEWIAPFKTNGHYDNARWAEVPKWDIHRAAPGSSVTVLGREIKIAGAFADLQSYDRKGMSPDTLGHTNGDELVADFFSLRDFWTAPAAPNFDKLVNDFVEVYAFYLEEIGVDGFRIDTVKHVHHAFWDAFTERLRERLGPERAKHLILFGEVYDGSPANDGDWTYRSDWPQNPAPALDSTLGFPFCYAARSYLRTNGKPFGTAGEMEKALLSLSPKTGTGPKRPFYNPTAGLDGLTSGQKVVNFIENHDGLNRFRVAGVSEGRNLLANALLLLAPGIPCLYYGTEAGLQDPLGKVGTDGETGRLTFIKGGEAQRFDAIKHTDIYKATAALTALREQLPALHSGETYPLWVDSSASDSDDGVFAFARGGDGLETVVIALNASDKPRVTAVPGHVMKLVGANGKPLLGAEDQLERVPLSALDSSPAATTAKAVVQWKNGVPEIELHLNPESVNIYRIRPGRP